MTQAATIENLQATLNAERALRGATENELKYAKAFLKRVRDDGYNQGLDEMKAFYQRKFAKA